MMPMRSELRDKVASRHRREGVRLALGMEFSESPHDQALENIVNHPRQRLACTDIAYTDIVSRNVNAVNFGPPAGKFAAFFFNPFPLAIVDQVAEQLQAAARAACGNVSSYLPIRRDLSFLESARCSVGVN
jgi:hypothetical protein